VPTRVGIGSSTWLGTIRDAIGAWETFYLQCVQAG
jgi:hypothetical protein